MRVGTLDMVRRSALLNLAYRLHMNPIKTQPAALCILSKPSKTWNPGKRPKADHRILKEKNKVKLPNFKTHQEATIIKTVLYWAGADGQIKGTALAIQKDSSQT